MTNKVIPSSPDPALAQAEVTCLDGGNFAQVTGVAFHEAVVQNLGPAPAGGFMMGTVAGNSVLNLTHQLKHSNPDWLAARAAFEEIKAQARTVPEYAEMEGCYIDIDHCVVTLRMRDNTVLELTIGELKEKIKAQSSQLDVERMVNEAFQRFELAFIRMGITKINHYSPAGPDALASSAGREALVVDRTSAPLIQSKQANDLESDVANQYGIAKFIERDPSLKKSEKKKNADKVLQTEAFRIALRDRLKKKIDAVTAEMTQCADKAKKEQLEKTVQRYTHLHDQLLHKMNRRALWASALYTDPEECFKRLLYDYYEDCYSEVKEPGKKPSFRQFCAMPDALEYQKNAAETASLLIVDPREYRSFCRRHAIEPRDHHVNRLLNVALNQAAQGIDFARLGYAFSQEERAGIVQLIDEAKGEAATLQKKIDELSPDFKGAGQYLKAAFKAKEVASSLADSQAPKSWFQRAKKIIGL